MVVLTVKCKTFDDMAEKRDLICSALVGNRAFIESEIMVCDIDDFSFCIVLGEENDHDVNYDVIISNQGD